ncbi:hypothetical protein A9762_22980 [Pandoraea sp. ISTKB]|nr:hypothetical protein A9762_22980 [Pandoraea sp. ISTKB]
MLTHLTATQSDAARSAAYSAGDAVALSRLSLRQLLDAQPGLHIDEARKLHSRAVAAGIVVARRFRERELTRSARTSPDFTPGLDNLSSGPQYGNLFDEDWAAMARPNAIEARTSPAAYLLMLYRRARALEASGSQDAFRLKLDERRPDIGTEVIDEKALLDEVTALSLSTQVLEYATRTAIYDEADAMLVALSTHKDDGTVLQALHYAYDPVGNVVRIEDATAPERFHRNRRTDGVCTFAYDTISQLSSASGRESAYPTFGPGLPDLDDDSLLHPYTQSYAYDASGNLVQMRHVGAQSFTRDMAVAPDSNRSLYHEDGAPAPDFGKGFDACGNQAELEPGQTMRWNARQQLAQVTQIRRHGKRDGQDDDERYAYDGSGQRVRKITRRVAARVTHTAEVLYLPALEIRQNSATGETLHIISVPTGLGAVRVLHWVSEPPASIGNDAVRYRLDDHLGSHVCELDDSADVACREGYYPFGTTAWQAGRNEIEVKYRTLRYSGKERDATGLLYYGFRYYAPWLQRWINPDPLGSADGLNRFAMLGNNPVSRVDRHGLLGEQASGNLWATVAIASLLFVAAIAVAITQRLRRPVAAVARRLSGQVSRKTSVDPSGESGPAPPVSTETYTVSYADKFKLGAADAKRMHAFKEANPSILQIVYQGKNLAGDSIYAGITNERQIDQLRTHPNNFAKLKLPRLKIANPDASPARTHRLSEGQASNSSTSAWETVSISSAASNKRSKSVATATATLDPVRERTPVPETPPPIYNIVESDKFREQRESLKGAAKTSVTTTLTNLLHGETTKHFLPVVGIPGVAKAYAEDVTGIDRGRGRWRMFYTRGEGNEFIIHGIGDYHKGDHGMKAIKWW